MACKYITKEIDHPNYVGTINSFLSFAAHPKYIDKSRKETKCGGT
jgi:hypothetical protein